MNEETITDSGAAHRAKKKELDRDRKRKSRGKEKEEKERLRAETEARESAREAETAARRAREEADEHATEIKRERDDDIQYELCGGSDDNSPAENQRLEQKIDDYLHEREHMSFEMLYNHLSLVRPGRYILKHFGVEPLEPGTYIEEGVGIQKRARGSGRMVKAIDGSWLYLTDDLIADYAARNIPIKSTRQLDAEQRAMSNELLDHCRRRALRFLAETKVKAAAEYGKYKQGMKELERTYLRARKINQEAACHSDKTQ